jgi:TPR repeat protein
MSKQRLFLAALSLLHFCCSCHLLVAEEPQRYALLIGVAKYAHAGMNQPEPLQFPEADARAIGDLLKESGYTVELLLGKEATRDVIREKFVGLRQQGDADGIVLVGLFGHGVEVETASESGDVVREACFCPYDTDMQIAVDARGNEIYNDEGQPLTEPDSESLVRLSELMIALKLTRAGNRVVLADCCRTTPNRARGRSFGAGFRAQDLPENTSILFGCAANEQAFEHPSWGHGAFTKSLIEEIRGNQLGEDIETAGLAVALKRRVPQLVSTVSPKDTQTPKLFSTDSISLQLKFDDPDAIRGYRLFWGIGEPIDEERAVGYLRRAADRRNAVASGLLAYSYRYGYGVQKDLAESKKLAAAVIEPLRVEAEQGKAKAQGVLGLLLMQNIIKERVAGEGTAWLRKGAEQNLALAQLRMGYIYANGTGVPRDDKVAFEWFSKAADQGDAAAIDEIGLIYEHGKGREKDLGLAVEYYRKSAEQGNRMGLLHLALCYDFGKGVRRSDSEASKWYLLAAERGVAQAQSNLGVNYGKGLGVRKDLAEAARWYRAAAEQGYANAQNNLAICYENGRGVEQNYREAVRWYRAAADQGNADAQANLGHCYLKGFGVERDPQEAVRWYRAAVEQGHANGMHNLGVLYMQGTGVEQSDTEAFKLFRRAAEKGEVLAQNNLAVFYSLGRGVAKNETEAVKWMLRSAEGGDGAAQKNMAYRYYKGEGVAKNSAEAIRWSRLALANAKLDDDSRRVVTQILQALGAVP